MIHLVETCPMGKADSVELRERGESRGASGRFRRKASRHSDVNVRCAISGDRCAHSLSRVESVTRVTPSTFATAVADRPSGSMISCSLKPSG